MIQTRDKLDAQAARELEEERQRLERNLGAMGPKDSGAIAREVDRHMDRVEEIMRELVSRRLPH